MPLPDIQIPPDPIVLYVGAAPIRSPSQAGPHVYIFQAPSSKWWWIGGLVRLRFNVQGDEPTNLGIYGVDPPVISGQYGLARFPVSGSANSYSGTRSPKGGTCYAVIRFDGPIIPNYMISIAKA
jgi:hypothetical protein